MLGHKHFSCIFMWTTCWSWWTLVADIKQTRLYHLGWHGKKVTDRLTLQAIKNTITLEAPSSAVKTPPFVHADDLSVRGQQLLHRQDKTKPDLRWAMERYTYSKNNAAIVMNKCIRKCLLYKRNDVYKLDVRLIKRLINMIKRRLFWILLGVGVAPNHWGWETPRVFSSGEKEKTTTGGGGGTRAWWGAGSEVERLMLV